MVAGCNAMRIDRVGYVFETLMKISQSLPKNQHFIILSIIYMDLEIEDYQ
jgi:hypothetical protein